MHIAEINSWRKKYSILFLNVFIALLQYILSLLRCYGAEIRITHNWINKAVVTKEKNKRKPIESSKC